MKTYEFKDLVCELPHVTVNSLKGAVKRRPLLNQKTGTNTVYTEAQLQALREFFEARKVWYAARVKFDLDFSEKL